MGYERNDRRYGRDDYRASNYGRGYDRNDRGYRDDDRGFFDRAGDEVRSWFGDEEAERRRRQDERYDERNEGGRYGYNRESGYRGSSNYGDGGRFADTSRYGGGGFGGGTFSGDRDARADWWRGEDHFQGQDRWQGQDRNSDFGRYSDRERENYRSQQGPQHGSHHDESYRSWRDRQMQDLDRDYDEYRRENQSRFESEFGTWRQSRQTQRASLSQVQEHQDVVGSDGAHVGKVDKVRGDRIILTKNDQDAGGHHHSIPSSWLKSVEGNQVTLSKTADEAKQAWKDEERNSAMFGNNDRGNSDNAGSRNLNRSFSGTY
ncbi:DUF2171 domain-containing protein [Sphingomonas sp. ID0503]|uniref:DUF2171 domain-containing protein n=1 Tax=Sphingomonas sp. ID0503 TaxID=3399691 RepID=UPI003AFAB0FD